MCKQVQRMKPNEKKKNTESLKSTFLLLFCSSKMILLLQFIEYKCVVGYILKFTRFSLETPCGLMLYIGGERLSYRRLPSNVHAKIAKFSELPAMIA